MKRREFIAGLLFAATAQRARAQKPAQMRRLVFIHPSWPVTELRKSPYGAFFEELCRLGYVEGRNLRVELFSGSCTSWYLEPPPFRYFIDADNPGRAAVEQEVQEAGRNIGVAVQVAVVTGERDFEATFAGAYRRAR